MTANLHAPRRSMGPRLTRGMAGIGIAIAVLLVLLSIALFAFALVLPAVLVLGLAVLVAAISGPALWLKLPDDKGQLGRPTH